MSSVLPALPSPRLACAAPPGSRELAVIPEAISFSIIAGVDPRVGLFAAFTMAVTISIVGGRPAIISAATGAVALVVAPIAREHGMGYLVATVILAGLFQILIGQVAERTGLSLRTIRWYGEEGLVVPTAARGHQADEAARLRPRGDA